MKINITDYLITMKVFNSTTTSESKNYLILIDALRETSKRLSRENTKYQWGHMGQCNAGQLIQTITGMSSFEIAESAQFKLDEWSEHANDYCSEYGCRVEDIFQEVEKIGMTHHDIVMLENLSDRSVLENLKGGFRHLKKNVKEDVVSYMESFADLLEKKQRFSQTATT